MANQAFEDCQMALDQWLRVHGELGEAVSVQFLTVIHGGRGYVFGNSQWLYSVLIDGTVTREPREPFGTVE